MTPNAPGQYRLIDEGAHPLRLRAAWNPLGLFFVAIVTSPLTLPVVAAFFWLNWGRLGFREKQKTWAAPTLVLALLPVTAIFGAAYLRMALSHDNASLVNTFAKFALGYPYLMAQRPIFETQRLRGERTVPAWWLWLLAAGLTAVGITLAEFLK